MINSAYHSVCDICIKFEHSYFTALSNSSEIGTAPVVFNVDNLKVD